MSVLNVSSAGLDGLLPPLLTNWTAMSNGQTVLNFFRAITNLVNVILEQNVLFSPQPYFFGAK